MKIGNKVFDHDMWRIPRFGRIQLTVSMNMLKPLVSTSALRNSRNPALGREWK